MNRQDRLEAVPFWTVICSCGCEPMRLPAALWLRQDPTSASFTPNPGQEPGCGGPEAPPQAHTLPLTHHVWT